MRADICSKKHFECFDLLTFLEMSSKNSSNASRWKCPICNVPLSLLNLYKCELTASLIDYVNVQFPTVPDEKATLEQQRKEVEYAYFDLTLFTKILCAKSISELENSPNATPLLPGQKFSNYNLIRIGGRYHILNYDFSEGIKFYEYAVGQAHLINVRDFNFRTMQLMTFPKTDL